MSEGLVAFVTAAYAVRWILAVIVVIAFAGLVAGANHRADKAEERADEWQHEAERLFTENVNLRQRLADRRDVAQVVALHPRKGTEASHG